MEYVMMITCFLCLLFTISFAATIYKRKNTSTLGKLPPGPVPFPIIGNLLAVGDMPHMSFASLANTHGQIMSLKLGQMTTIVISSSEMARRVFRDYDLPLSSRPVLDALKVHNHHKAALPWLPASTEWKNQRKLCSLYIFSTKKLDENQQVRCKVLQQIIEFVRKCCVDGKAVDIGQIAFRNSLNSISNTILSVDLADSNSETAKVFRELSRGIMEEVGKPNLSDYFPIFKKLDVQGIRRRSSVHFGKILQLFDQMIAERSKLRQESDFVSSNDVLDTLLDVCSQNSLDFDKNHIKDLFLQLFVAGTDTTSSTLEWAMAELLRNPNILYKAKNEMIQIIGTENELSESDITRLPYLKAVIKETLRLHPAVPLLVPRKATEDVGIDGYVIPKDSTIFINVWAIGRDPLTWEDPNSFVPERFLNSKIDMSGQHFELIPFGAGRRICPGLPLALRVLHLLLGSLIHHFDWKLEDGVTSDTLSMEEKSGITLQKSQPLRAIPLPISHLNLKPS